MYQQIVLSGLWLLDANTVHALDEPNKKGRSIIIKVFWGLYVVPRLSVFTKRGIR